MPAWLVAQTAVAPTRTGGACRSHPTSARSSDAGCAAGAANRHRSAVYGWCDYPLPPALARPDFRPPAHAAAHATGRLGDEGFEFGDAALWRHASMLQPAGKTGCAVPQHRHGRTPSSCSLPSRAPANGVGPANLPLKGVGSGERARPPGAVTRFVTLSSRGPGILESEAPWPGDHRLHPGHRRPSTAPRHRIKARIGRRFSRGSWLVGRVIRRRQGAHRLRCVLSLRHEVEVEQICERLLTVRSRRHCGPRMLRSGGGRRRMLIVR